MRSKRAVWFIMLLIVSGCAATVPEIDANFLVPDFRTRGIDEIKFLPILDIRLDKDINVDYQQIVSDGLLGVLRKRGYNVDVITKNVDQISLAEIASKSRDPIWIKSLAPEYNRWILLVTLNKIYWEQAILLTKAYAELSGYLFDRDAGELVWSHTAPGEIGQVIGPLLIPIFLPAFYKDSLRMATYNLSSAFPRKRDNK
jgi:hypothetical protein